MPAVHRPLTIQTAQKPSPRTKTLPPSLHIGPTKDISTTTIVQDDNPSSALSEQSEADSVNVLAKPPLLRNRKKLSLTILTQPNDSSTSLSGSESPFVAPNTPLGPPTRRRASVVSLPNVSSIALRRDEESSPSAPYPDGPVEILPGIWIGTEDHAREWRSLVPRGIRAILNVAKEVASPYAPLPEPNLRTTVSTPSLSTKFCAEVDSTYIPPHIPSGRPSMHYLRLPWSHGQADLVHHGFVEGMSFVDASLARGDGVLIHCQCGVSRSATIVIALVMRAAHSTSPTVPSDVLALKSGGMHASYAYVKERSKWVGPNMSLMYQLLEYERILNLSSRSPTMSDRSSQIASEEAEWGRKRQAMDEVAEHENERGPDSLFLREARALDLEMEQRIEARRLSQPSIASITSSESCFASGTAWKSRFGTNLARSRAGSAASTNHSILSEDLMEEDEDNLGTDTEVSVDNSSLTTSADLAQEERLLPHILSGPPPSAPAFRNSFALPPPPSASHHKTSFGVISSSNIPFPRHNASRYYASHKLYKKSAPRLPPVPPSPILDNTPTPRKRARPSPAPLLLPSEPYGIKPSFATSLKPKSGELSSQSQTLFVFPPEQSVTTPSTLTLMSNLIPFSTPRVSSFRKEGRHRTLILGPPPTPTTACSRVDAFRC